MPPSTRKRTVARAAVIPFPSAAGGLARALPSGRALLIAAAAVAAVVGAYAVARATPLFALDRIEVTGAPAPLERQIRHALEPLDGESLLAFRGGQADARLAAIPEIATASYDRAFPHTLRIAVVPEHPVAVLRQGSSAWLAAASGRVLAAQPANAHARLPRVWLAAATNVIVGRRLGDTSGLRALSALWRGRVAGFKTRIRFVRSTPQDLTLILRSGVELRLGELDRIGLKLAIASRLLPDVGKPAKGPAYLDLTVPLRPVASTDNPQVTSEG